MRTDLHIVSPNDEMSRRNGSAILTVAKRLQEAAEELGHNSWIGGASHPNNDLGCTISLLQAKSKHTQSRPAKIADNIFKLGFGKSLSSPELTNTDVSPTHIYCHNQPWLIHKLREMFPDAKVTLYIHNRIFQRARPAIMRKIMDQCDAIICVSDYIRQDLIRRARVKDLREHPPLYVALNGVDALPYMQVTDKPIDTKYDVVYVGRIVPGKGVHVLADALQQVAKLRPVSVLVVGGHTFIPGKETGYVRQVQENLAKNNLSAEFTGPVPPSEVPALMNTASVHVAPSIWPEACPLVVLEGLASKACVIGTSTGGTPEIAAQTALQLVDPNDSDKLAKTILHYLEDEKARNADSSAQQKWAASRTWLSVYKTIVAIDEAN